MKIRLAIVACLAFAVPLLAACGGSDDHNSGDRPSAEELAKAFADVIPEGTPGAEEVTDCIGRELEASDLPNGVLRSMAAGDEETSVDADNKDKYEKIVTDATQLCVEEATAALTGGS